jgi:hypothetical protein
VAPYRSHHPAAPVTEDELTWVRRQLQHEATTDLTRRHAAQGLARIVVTVLDLLNEAVEFGQYAGDDVVAAIEALQAQVKATLRAAAELLAWFE